MTTRCYFRPDGRELSLAGRKPNLFTFLGFLFLQLALVTGQGEAVRSQTFALREGWNAVYLAVYPSTVEPAILFQDTPVDIVAAHFDPGSSAQFVTDPGVDLFKQAGWGVWYAENRPDAFLKTLHAIQGQRVYLIHCKEDHTWTLSGQVGVSEVIWKADAYNLVGFNLSAQAPPTFGAFFAGSPAHRHNRIYRLVNNNWRRVSAPDAELMRDGEAFWIFSDGGSTYQGPLRVETVTRQGLVLGAGPASVVLRNAVDHPLAPTLEHLVSANQTVPLSIRMQATGGPLGLVDSVLVPLPAGSWTQPLPPLEGGAAVRVPLELRLEDMNSAQRLSLLRITTDMGTESWIPVIAVRDDLEER